MKDSGSEADITARVGQTAWPFGAGLADSQVGSSDRGHGTQESPVDGQDVMPHGEAELRYLSVKYIKE